MIALGPAAAREADARTIAAGTPGIVLMERAAEAVARECLRAVAGVPLRGERVVVLCGTGNNGGDGFGAARLLRRSPRVGAVSVLLLGPRARVAGDAAETLRRLERDGGEVVEVSAVAGLEPLRGATLVVDALFGTGLSRPLEAESLASHAARIASGRRAFVVAVDLPSGLDAGSGELVGPHVRADLTVTFGAPKIAHVFPPAAAACGRVVVADIGLLPAGPTAGGSEAVTALDVAPLFPPRPAAVHKGTYGTLAVVGGARGMAGAAALAARAAFRAGAGKVVVVAAEPSREAVHALVAEATTAEALPETGPTAVAVGPGLGTDAWGAGRLEEALATPLPVVLDADALNLLRGRPGTLAGRPGPTVLTPHPGEAARLLGLAASAVAGDPESAARRLAAESGATVVLKGFRSVVATPAGRLARVLSGNPGLATGGSGDVLTGIVGALLARGRTAWEAATAGAYLHGLAGDLVRERLGEESLRASDLPEELGRSFAAVAESVLP
ncbi:MAG TPA: NAD(P)H-hydrate dehydratase [Thermoanaerobaculia bacterium]|nr:NAD(P)H-hydrate dehydratase [Thermoanaerobaculia bacterium]